METLRQAAHRVSATRRRGGPTGMALTGVAVVAGFAAVVVACRVVFDAPYSIILDGVSLGALYGLIGAGVILIYRTNRIINFAAAGLGALPGVAGVLLIVNRGISWWLVFPVALLAGCLLGALVDILVIRRFARAPRLILTVVTIGVGQLLAFIALYLPDWIPAPGREVGGTFISKVDTPWRTIDFLRVGNRQFNGDYPFAVVFTILLVVGLAAFFRYTRIGIALRASAENADRASLLGIPVKRVGTVAWVLAGLFATATIFLRSTLVGVPVDGTLGPVVLLYALAAAVIARMDSVPMCLAAGVAIGMIDQASVFKTARSTLGGAIMLVLIIGALLLQRTRLSRAQDSGVSSFAMVKEFRPIPRELRDLTEVRLAKGALGVLVAAFLLAVPFILGPGRLSRATPIVLVGIVAVSLVILTGWAGQISLGQFGLVGVGALVAGGLAGQWNQDFFVSLFAGVLAGAFVAVLVGLPALRIQGLFLAVTTLAFAQAASGFLLNRSYAVRKFFLPDSVIRVERPLLFERIDLSSDRNYYYFCLVFFALALLAARAYRRNRAGRVLMAVRDNQRAAPAYAINLARNRLAAFAISGGFAAMAGVLLVYEQGALDQESYGIGPSILVFVATVIGGVTSLAGGVFGAVLIQSVRTYGESYVEGLSLLVTGPGLVLILMFLPGGLAEAMYRVRDGFLRWVANRHGILVPSLVADRRVETGEDELEVVTGAEQHVGEVDSFAHLAEATIQCPACGQVLSVSDAPDHEHLQPASTEPRNGGGGGDGTGELEAAGGGRSARRRARTDQGGGRSR